MSHAEWDATDLFPEREAAKRRTVRPAASLLLVAILLLLSSLLVWANYALLDEVTRAQGRVVPSLKTQEIQNLEGGILSELLVREGDQVVEGQPLLRINKTIAKSKFQRSQAEYRVLIAEIARLHAEAEGKEPVFPKSLEKSNPEIIANEWALYRNRRRELENDVDILKGQVLQKEQELLELRNKISGLAKSRSLLLQEVAMNRPLVSKGAVSAGELLKLRRELQMVENEYQTTQLAIPRIKSGLTETKQRVKARHLTFKNDVLSLLNQREARLKAIMETATAEKDRMRRTEVQAPLSGIVNRIHFMTINGVIQPGETIMEITPIDDTLLIEAWVSPQDIAFLRPGLPGKVTITAYDSSIFGQLDAFLEDLSSDTFKDSEKELGYYRIHMRTESNSFSRDGRQHPIIPGMTASVDIMTGKKSLLDYILKPILKVKQHALTER
ncbi:MAG: HlyD family type I secretion periplasmic adaptor subunit [Magnetococcales bacterium]|nr:HlyD family type I secretion periplasmic adaptor subunit [Magnetococcales bacterium]